MERNRILAAEHREMQDQLLAAAAVLIEQARIHGDRARDLGQLELPGLGDGGDVDDKTGGA